MHTRALILVSVILYLVGVTGNPAVLTLVVDAHAAKYSPRPVSKGKTGTAPRAPRVTKPSFKAGGKSGGLKKTFNLKAKEGALKAEFNKVAGRPVIKTKASQPKPELVPKGGPPRNPPTVNAPKPRFSIVPKGPGL